MLVYDYYICLFAWGCCLWVVVVGVVLFGLDWCVLMVGFLVVVCLGLCLFFWVVIAFGLLSGLRLGWWFCFCLVRVCGFVCVLVFGLFVYFVCLFRWVLGLVFAVSWVGFGFGLVGGVGWVWVWLLQCGFCVLLSCIWVGFVFVVLVWVLVVGFVLRWVIVVLGLFWVVVLRFWVLSGVGII